MINAGEITRGMFLGTAEIAAEFSDPGDAAAARANLDVFLRWALDASAKPPPAAVVLIVTQSKLDPVEDRPRRVDWPTPPEVRMPGSTVSVDAPRSKSARDTVRKVLENSRPKAVLNRRRLPTTEEKKRAVRSVAILVAAAVVIVGAIVAGVVLWIRK